MSEEKTAVKQSEKPKKNYKTLKRVLTVIGIVILVVVVLLVTMTACNGYKEKNYYKYATPSGEIEKKYTDMGVLDVSYDEYKSDNAYKKYEIWYPSEMKEKDVKYPLVIMANGTGIKASKYKEVFKHLASWGFIVAGNEDENSRTGASSAATLDYILKLNEDTSSKFYGKIDTDNIGIAGHSQGGVGAVNAVTQQANGNLYKAVFTASMTSSFWGQENQLGLEWSYDMSKVNIPCFMVAGTGFFDAGKTQDPTATDGQGICPLWGLTENYNAISDTVTKLMAREKDKDHSDMLRYADGYMTAWFMYHLKGDEAADFFSGDNAEIVSNANWQDVKKNI